MIKMKFFISILIGLSVFLSGCSSVNNALMMWREPIYGTWGFQDKASGQLRLKFSKDGQFEVDADADGDRDIWGEFTLFRNRIQFVDAQPRITSDCYEPGFHIFTIDDGILKFREFTDQCKPRKFILKRPFKREKATRTF